MKYSNLDKTLSGILAPLVENDAIVRVPAFANTIGLAYHYWVALYGSGKSFDDNMIGYYNWSNPKDVFDNIDGFYMCYGSRAFAEGLKKQDMETQDGFFDSLPITRYLPRKAFISTKLDMYGALAKHRRLNGAFIADIMSVVDGLNVMSDIRPQADSIFTLLFKANPGPSQLRYCKDKWPSGACLGAEKETNIYFYGAPCTEFMSQLPDIYRPLAIDESLIATDPNFETHVIWHLPLVHSDLNPAIRECLFKYHALLFESATDDSFDDEFSGLMMTCNEILADRHPSFSAQVYSNPRSFRRSLALHHANPSRQ